MKKNINILWALLFAVLIITACEQPAPPIIYVISVDKSELETAISDAEQLHTAHLIGSEPGDVSEEASSGLSIAIEEAKAVFQNLEASQAEVDEAVLTLESAVLIFNAAIITPDSYDPGSEWILSWSDEFDDGVFDTDIWDRQIWLSPPNGEWEQYTGEASTAYESDGKMILKATYDGPVHGYGNYTSARVISNPGGGSGNSGSTGKVFKYGKIAARIKLPSGKGIWPAFWMLGDNINETGGTTSWPGCGEIDILETGSVHANDGYFGHATAGQAIHFSNSVGNWQYFHGSNTLISGQYSDNYHVFEIEWDEERIIWKIDGTEAHREDITASYLSEFHENFYVIFNIAVGGNYTYEPDASTSFPQYMYIDWLRHYEKN